jgi:hypothetical protein
MNKAINTPHSVLSPPLSWGHDRHYVGQRQGHTFSRAAITIVLLYSFFMFAQHQEEPFHAAEPTVIFDQYWEAATPQNFTITQRASGAAKYASRNPTRTSQGEEAADPDYLLEFTMSPANRDRVFTLAKTLNYFNGNFDYKHKAAFTGTKTMIYADPVRYFKTSYNYSENKDIDELTRLFQGISNTVEHGRKLQFVRRFDKLGLERELKGMEELARNGYLAEIQIIAPTLQSIANDSSVLHMARERAQRLLENLNPRQGINKAPL